MAKEAPVPVLRVCCDPDVPAGVALMRLILATESAADLDKLLGQAIAGSDRRATVHLRKLAALTRQYSNAWRLVRAAAAAVGHDPDGTVSAEEAVQRLADNFDAAARASPEASVALYSLGDPRLLAAATDEIVSWMRQGGLLGKERTILDIGCGIGRLEYALHAEVRHIVGTDISREMVELAQRRCAGLEGVSIRRVSGLDLADFSDGTFDTVLAVDSRPYLVSAGGDLAGRHFAEAARILRREGDLLILNYSYRGNLDLDRDDVAQHACANDLAVIENGSHPLRLWDAAAFRLRKTDERQSMAAQAASWRQ
jgi:SAM-dependent methyltransferase